MRRRKEQYGELLQHRMAKVERASPDCNPAESCNGLSVLIDGKVISVDLFGNEESYRYYFPMLRDAAFTLSRTGEQKEPADKHESYFKALAAIDEFNDAGLTAEENHPGAGTLFMTDTGWLVGFSLMHGEEMIHKAFFPKQN